MNTVKVIEVKTKKDIKEFIEYPLRLYKGNKYFVPPLYADEKALFTSKNIFNKTCSSIYFLAKRGKITVGRIQGILQNSYNTIRNKKQVRFTRFDCENNPQTAKLLLLAVEEWAKTLNMNEVVGPLGYSDLEREGLLIEGFDYLSTFEEQYNYSYYQKLIEDNGYVKDVDWVEYRLFPVFPNQDKLRLFAERAKKRSNVHIAGDGLSLKAYVKKYKDGIFACIDECYKDLYGTVPFTPEMIKQMVDQFTLVLNKRFIVTVCDENEKVVAFGFCIPGFGSALQRSGGRLTLPTIIKMLRAVKRPKTLDLALVGVLPEYQMSGISAMILLRLQEEMVYNKVDYVETNLNLEDNVNVQGQWKFFEHFQHKRRRCFIKKLD